MFTVVFMNLIECGQVPITEGGDLLKATYAFFISLNH